MGSLFDPSVRIMLEARVLPCGPVVPRLRQKVRLPEAPAMSPNRFWLDRSPTTFQ